MLLYYLLRGIACGFNVFNEDAKYSSSSIILTMILKMKAPECKNIRFYDLFTKDAAKSKTPDTIEREFDSIVNPEGNLFS